jgi:hypothetical protein
MKGDHQIMAVASYGTPTVTYAALNPGPVGAAFVAGNPRSRKVRTVVAYNPPGDAGFEADYEADPTTGTSLQHIALVCNVAHLGANVVDPFWDGHPLADTFVPRAIDDYAVSWESGNPSTLNVANMDGDIEVDAASPSYRSP